MLAVLYFNSSQRSKIAKFTFLTAFGVFTLWTIVFPVCYIHWFPSSQNTIQIIASYFFLSLCLDVCYVLLRIIFRCCWKPKEKAPYQSSEDSFDYEDYSENPQKKDDNSYIDILFSVADFIFYYQRITLSNEIRSDKRTIQIDGDECIRAAFWLNVLYIISIPLIIIVLYPILEQRAVIRRLKVIQDRTERILSDPNKTYSLKVWSQSRGDKYYKPLITFKVQDQHTKSINEPLSIEQSFYLVPCEYYKDEVKNRNL